VAGDLVELVREHHLLRIRLVIDGLATFGAYILRCSFIRSETLVNGGRISTNVIRGKGLSRGEV
jgi:hypothetical protein